MLFSKMISMAGHEILSNTSFLNTEFNTALLRNLRLLILKTKSKTIQKGIYIETPSNPTLKIIDLKAISILAKNTGMWTMIDNTFASPVNQNPMAIWY